MKELIKKCHMNSANKGFWEDVRAIEVLYQNCIIDKKFKESMINNAIATRLALIQSEVSEALEELRKGDMENFKEELADICIRIFDLSGGLKIDLEEKILEKMKKMNQGVTSMERSFKRVELVIPGEPVAKGRPRVGKGFTYTPKKTVIYENFVKECYIITNTNKKLTGAIFCEIKAYFQIPKSKSKKIKEKMKAGEERPTKKPDLDNLAKSILDSLNQIAYDDDSQVVELKMSKFYSDNPRVEVILQEI